MPQSGLAASLSSSEARARMPQSGLAGCLRARL